MNDELNHSHCAGSLLEVVHVRTFVRDVARDVVGGSKLRAITDV